MKNFKLAFTLIEMLIVIIIIGISLVVSIVNVSSYVDGLRLKNAKASLIQDLQFSAERAKMGSQTFVIFGTSKGTYTGTYTVLVGGDVFENPIWLSNTEKKRDMRNFHLMPNNPSFSFATTTAFVETATRISLSSKGRSKYVTVSHLGRVE